MADAIFGSPIFSLTPAEEARILNDEANSRQERTAWEKENDAAPFSSFVSGARSSSVIGAGLYRGIQKGFQFFSPSGSQDPLNIARSRSEYNPATDPMSHGINNNIDSITEALRGIPFEEYPYVLTATSHADFEDRLDFVRMGLPEVQARMKGNVGLGKAVGMATDISAMMAIGAIAEPLALAGLGTRTNLAGKAVYEAGGYRLQPLAEAVTAAAETVGRTHLAFRYGALGIAEEAMFQAVKEGIDPNSNPDASEVLFNLTLAGGISGVLGGAIFGRTFVRQNIQEAADDLRRMRVTDLPGGYTINVAPNWAFSSTANADGVMFARGFGTADELGVELHADWEKTGDMFIPGSRTVSNIPVTSGGFRAGTVDIGGEITRFPPYEVATSGRFIPGGKGEVARKVFAATDFAKRLFHTISEPTDLLNILRNGTSMGKIKLNVVAEEGAIRLEFAAHKLKGTVSGNVDRATYESSNIGLDITTNPRTLSKRLKGVTVKVNQINEDDLVTVRNALQKAGLKELPQVGDELRFIRPGSKVKSGKSAASTVKTFKTSKGSVYEAHPDGTTTRTKAARPEHPGDSGLKPRSTRTVYLSEKDVNALSEINTQGGPRKAIAYVKTAEGDRVGIRYAEGKDAGNFERRTVVPYENSPRVGLYPLEMWSDGTIHFGNPITEMGGQVAAKVKPVKMLVRGAASTVKTIVKSLEDLGVPVDQELFKKVSRGVLAAEQSRLAGKAFNTRLWEEVAKELGNPQQAQLISEALINRVLPRFSTVDRNVLSVASRENMITAIHKGFKSKMHLDPNNPQSLIFQVLEDIEKRGGNIDREMVAGVIDDLRGIVQNPPKRLNKLGRKTVDTLGRRRAVVDIINKRIQNVPGSTPIEIPKNLLKKMSMRSMAPVTSGGTVSAATGSPSFENVPRVTMRIPILSNFLNQAALAMQSENGIARYMGHIAFNARRVHDGVQPTTIFEHGIQIVQSTLFHFSVAYRNGSTKFAMGVKGETVTDSPTLINAVLSRFGKRNKEISREFDERVSAVLRSGTPDAVEAVNETAEGAKKLFQRLHNIAFEAGVSGFTNSAVVNYLPRLWRFERIRRLTGTEEGMNDLVTLLQTSFERGGRKIVIDGVEQTIQGDVRQAAVVFANRLKRIAFETENAPLLAQDQELVDSLAGLMAPLKAKGTSKTPFGRSRITLDEAAGITGTADHLNIGTANLRLADLVSNDLGLIFKRYTTSVMGAVNEKRFLNAMNEAATANGLKGPMVDGVQQPFKKLTSIDEVIALAKDVAGPINPNHESGLREVLSAMRFEPLHSGTAEFSDKAKGILMSYGYLVKGGQFGLAQLGETARVVGSLGLLKTIKQMPILEEMVTNWWNLDRPTQNFASWIDSWMSPSTDRLRRQFISVGLDMNERESKGVRGGLDMAANLLADVSGLAPLTSWTQQLTAATTMQHLWEVANKGVTRLDNATLKGLGLTSDQYERLVAYVGRNAEIKEGFMGDRVVGMAGMDMVEMDLLRDMVDRVIRTRIQDMPTRGDFAKSLFGFWGSAATQFRSFNLKGIDNFLLQNVGRVQQGGGKRVAAEIGSTLLFSGIIAYGRNYADWRSYKNTSDTEKTKELESTLTAGGFVRGAVAGPSEFFLGIMGADAAWQGPLLNPDPLFSQYRYSGQSTFGFPLEDTLKRTYGLTKDLYGATVGKAVGSPMSRDFTQRTLHSARLSLFGQNLPGLKQFLNVAESEIADYYRLAETQPRDR